nr:Chain C, INDUCER PEPTIDE TIP3 [Escherichia coli]
KKESRVVVWRLPPLH